MSFEIFCFFSSAEKKTLRFASADIFLGLSVAASAGRLRQLTVGGEIVGCERGSGVRVVECEIECDEVERVVECDSVADSAADCVLGPGRELGDEAVGGGDITGCETRTSVPVGRVMDDTGTVCGRTKGAGRFGRGDPAIGEPFAGEPFAATGRATFGAGAARRTPELQTAECGKECVPNDIAFVDAVFTEKSAPCCKLCNLCMLVGRPRSGLFHCCSWGPGIRCVNPCACRSREHGHVGAAAE